MPEITRQSVKFKVEGEDIGAEDAYNEVIKLLKGYCRYENLSHIDFDAMFERLRTEGQIRFCNFIYAVQEVAPEQAEELLHCPWTHKDEYGYEDYIYKVIGNWT